MALQVYTSKEVFADQGCSVLVIACSSHAYLTHIKDFLANHLGIGEGKYDLLAVPGGPQFLLLSEYLPKFAWAGQKWVRFFVEKKKVTRVIVISHENCGWYDDDRLIPQLISKLGHAGKTIKEHQRDDLKEVATALSHMLGAVAVEAYYIEKGIDGKLNFIHEA